jgi:hypothetical protein
MGCVDGSGTICEMSGLITKGCAQAEIKPVDVRTLARIRLRMNVALI